MALSTAFSVASFTVVLAETFAAVGLSSLAPAAFAQVASKLKEDPSNNAVNAPLAAAFGLPASLGGEPIIDRAIDAVRETLKGIAPEAEAITLLTPNKATIDAEFEFHASESYGGAAEIGGMIELVTVKAGYQYLFQVGSSNKVKLHVEFAPVEYEL